MLLILSGSFTVRTMPVSHLLYPFIHLKTSARSLRTLCTVNILALNQYMLGLPLVMRSFRHVNWLRRVWRHMHVLYLVCVVILNAKRKSYEGNKENYWLIFNMHSVGFCGMNNSIQITFRASYIPLKSHFFIYISHLRNPEVLPDDWGWEPLGYYLWSVDSWLICRSRK